MYDWSLHCGACQGTRLAYLYEWRNMIYANHYVGLTGIEVWNGWPNHREIENRVALRESGDAYLASPTHPKTPER